MVQAIVEAEEGIGIKGPKRIQIAAKTIVQACLAKFVNKNTLNFFRCLEIATGFLDADPSTWDSRDDYKIASSVANGLKVVNDLAERGIALIE